ncbi:hypothetical protein DYB28_014820, partial [Aphanomyces astaci]
KFNAAWRITFEEAAVTAGFFSLYTNETYCPTRIETDTYTISQTKPQVDKIRNDAKYSTDGYAGDALEPRLATVKRLEQDFTRKFLDEYIAESLAALRVQAKAFLFNSLTPILRQVIGSHDSPFSLWAALMARHEAGTRDPMILFASLTQLKYSLISSTWRNMLLQEDAILNKKVNCKKVTLGGQERQEYIPFASDMAAFMKDYSCAMCQSITQAVLVEIRDNFAAAFSDKFRDRDAEDIINVNETSVYYDMPPGKTLTPIAGEDKILPHKNC